MIRHSFHPHFLIGQLSCPKPHCGAKLGHFNWCGQPCPCGHWVVPAFHLAASKVDQCAVDVRDPNASVETEPGACQADVESSIDSSAPPGTPGVEAEEAQEPKALSGSPMKTADAASLASSDSPASVTSA